MDKPVLEFISAVLDVTAVKPLIECCTGYDMITGEDLSDFERGMKAVSGVVSLFTLGQGSIVMNGGKIALGETVKMGAKILAVDAVSTGVAYGTSEICQAMGCPGGLTLVFSMLAGMGSSAGLGSKVFGRGGVTPDDVAYQRHWNEGVSGTVESGSYASPNKIGNLLDGRPELTGSTRDRLLSTVQDSELSKIVDQLYRQGATVGDGGTAAILVEEFNNGASKHLIKATERLKQLRNLAGSGKLNLNDLDIVEALIDDLDYAIGLFD